jgi:predicted DNA-binding protein
MPSRKTRIALTLGDKTMANLEILSKALGKPKATLITELLEPILEQTNYIYTVVSTVQKDKEKLKALEEACEKHLDDINLEVRNLILQANMKFEEKTD